MTHGIRITEALVVPARERFRSSCVRFRAGALVGWDGCEVRLCDQCSRVRPCAPCVSRVQAPPVFFHRYRVLCPVCVPAPPGVFLPGLVCPAPPGACLLASPGVFEQEPGTCIEKFASSQNEFVQNKVHGLRALRAVTDHDGLICSDSGSCPSSSGRSPWQEARLLLRRDYLHRAGASTHANPSLDGGVGSSRRRGGRGKG
jgi:hypothetical protein